MNDHADHTWIPIWKKRWVVWSAIGLGFCVFACYPVATRQGVNYQVRETRMPLGWKIIHFLSRHHQMMVLSRQIVQRHMTEEERALAIYDWVRANLYLGVPEGLPVVDDHVFHIAIRHYGTEDQWADLFTALCAYAGLRARWDYVHTPTSKRVAAVPVVTIGGRLIVMDPYRGFVAQSSTGELLDLSGLQQLIRSGGLVSGRRLVRGVPYEEALLALSASSGGMNRGVSQMPLPRLFQLIRQKTLQWVSDEQGGHHARPQ